MISHKYKCVFIHIPKCAGTSIESALGHLDNHNGRGGQDHRSIRMIEQPWMNFNAITSKENIAEILRRPKHQYSKKVLNPKNKYTLTKEQYDSYFKFTIIRNPWARAFSLYKNVMNDEIHKKNLKITKDLSLREFLNLYAGKGMLRPQVYWIKNFEGKISLDYIGRFENLSEDVHEIFKKLQLENIKLPHKIKGTGKDYREIYDDESIQIVSEVYKEEIRMFNYTFNI